MIDSNSSRGDERGMTGIGVLILFIALVLVAAIAAGLILDTAGTLQNTAQDTGEQSTSAVSDRISVLSASGGVGAVTDATVYELTITVNDSSSNSVVGDSNTTLEIEDSTGDRVEVTETNDAGDAYVVSVANGETYTLEAGYNGAEYASDTVDIDGSGDSITLSTDSSTSATSNWNGNAPQQAGPVGDIDVWNEVTALDLTVYRSPGASDVTLKHVTIEYFAPNGTAFLMHEEEFPTDVNAQDEFARNIGKFTTNALKDGDVSTPVLNSRDDRMSLVVPLFTNPSGDQGEPQAMRNLEAGDSATLRLTTQEGATSMYIVNVPESLAGRTGSTVQL